MKILVAVFCFSVCFNYISSVNCQECQVTKTTPCEDVFPQDSQIIRGKKGPKGNHKIFFKFFQYINVYFMEFHLNKIFFLSFVIITLFLIELIKT